VCLLRCFIIWCSIVVNACGCVLNQPWQQWK
jgi:hypothetical protein